MAEWDEAEVLYRRDREGLITNVQQWVNVTARSEATKQSDRTGNQIASLSRQTGIARNDKIVTSLNKAQHKAREAFDPLAEKIKGLVKQIDLLYKLATRSAEIVEKELNGREAEEWNLREVNKQKKELDSFRKESVDQLKLVAYFHKQAHWLQIRFPDAKLADVEGLVKLVDRKEIAKNDWSLTPGRYVGVAPPEEDEDFDFEEALREIHVELADLNKEAEQLGKTIQQNFEELGI